MYYWGSFLHRNTSLALTLLFKFFKLFLNDFIYLMGRGGREHKQEEGETEKQGAQCGAPSQHPGTMTQTGGRHLTD